MEHCSHHLGGTFKMSQQPRSCSKSKSVSGIINQKIKVMNKFAVTGSVLELMLFERELDKLDFKNVSTPVYIYRGGIERNKFPTHITVGLHVTAKKPLEYTVAMNDGNAKDIYGTLFQLPEQFEEALALAKENSEKYGSKFTSEEGTKLYPGDKVYIVNDLFVLIPSTISMHSGKSESTKFFVTKSAAESYINENEKIYSRKDVWKMMNDLKTQFSQNNLNF